MQLIAGEQLWEALRKAALSSTRLDAAVAFIGKDPKQVLRWPAKTILVTALTEDRVRTGSTSAKGVRKLVDKGASVRSFPNLHAKVYVFNKVAFVGSANASESSSRLHEAAIKLTRPKEVEVARRFVANLWRQADPVDGGILQKLIRLEPKRFFVPGGGARHGRKKAAGRRRWWAAIEADRDVWIDAVSPDEPPKSVENARGKIAVQLADQQEVDRAREVEWTGMRRSNYKKVPDQDWVFVWWEPTTRCPYGRLEGPLRCLGGYDLGRRLQENRYARAESGVRMRTLTLDGRAIATLSTFVRQAHVGTSRQHAAHLQSRIGENSIRLRTAHQKHRLERLLDRLSRPRA